MKTHTNKPLPLALALAALMLNLSALQPATAASWVTTGPMTTARTSHTATLLPNGKVLVAGGQGTGGDNLSSAELYDPATDMWTATGAMTTGRYLHTATLLPNGKLLVAGGMWEISSAELYDPATGTWTATGPLTTGRGGHTAILLPNGQVLVAGGYDSNGFTLSSAELYDPATGSWTVTGTLTTDRGEHTATLLPNGKVLVAAGQVSFKAFPYNRTISSAELYDPAIGTWTVTSVLTTAREDHTVTLLPNGRVLVAGGDNYTNYTYVPLSSAELYDPATGTWTATGALNTGRNFHTATLLPNGKVVIAGGASTSGYLSSAELFDPATGTWTATAAMTTEHYAATATLLPNGQVLVVGGDGGSGALSSAELYEDAVPLPTTILLTQAAKLLNGAFQFRFTNPPGLSFSVFGATNPALPFSNWVPLSGITEGPPGQYQFTDPQAANTPQRFYRVRSP